MATDLGFTLGGIDFVPAGPNVDPNQNIIRPELQDGPLDIEELQRVLRLFAGNQVGGGVQNLSGNLDPTTTAAQNQIVSVDPTGVFSPAGQNYTPGILADEGQPEGQFSLTDIMGLMGNLGNAGNQRVANPFENFEQAGNGTFNLRPQGAYQHLARVGPGMLPYDQAIHSETGEPFSKQNILSNMRARYGNIDESPS
ncbi:MAG: hypothetical protein O3A53_14810 [Acidobacteria bacterium]|nr:hypothetical protein [Acidobacteriota bacterium]MDA1236056.1 hypothetical protein [Acidobacteriota bacterium]